MREYNHIIFVGQTGACREAMAAGILHEFLLKHQAKISARGLVVLFPEPMNQKAEAVLISNGITPEEFTSVQLAAEELKEDALILTMEHTHRDRILQTYDNAIPDNIFTLNEFVGDELEIMDPYGGPIAAYGLCYESIRKSIRKLVRILNGDLPAPGEDPEPS